MALTSRNEADILAAAAWAESHERLFGTCSAGTNNLDPASTTSLGYKLKIGQFARTFWCYHKDAGTNYLEVGWMSKMFTYYPGSENWANQKLTGVTTDALTEGQFKAIESNNGNTFEMFGNSFSATQVGKVAANEWIDIIRFRDWLVQAVRVSVVSALINADKKIPHTDPGYQVIAAAIIGPLSLGRDRDGIAPPELDIDGQTVIKSWTVTLPKSAAVPVNDKANRVLHDVYFSARLAGALNLVEIKGSMSYAL